MIQKRKERMFYVGLIFCFFLCPLTGFSEIPKNVPEEKNKTTMTVTEEEYPVQVPKIPAAVTKPPKIPSSIPKTVPSVHSQVKQEKWWIPQKPYQQWSRDNLFKHVRSMQELRSQMIAQGENAEIVLSVTQQIDEAQDILASTF